MNGVEELGESRGTNVTTGLLLSGGLDSSILLRTLLAEGRQVQPFYTRCGLYWEYAEERAVKRFLEASSSSRLLPLKRFELPLTDMFWDHWSVTGQSPPDACSSDLSVFLPGRNVLLTIKAAIWCQLHQVQELALATLNTNPFSDASPEFFEELEKTLKLSLSSPLRVICPFGALNKQQVMELGKELPLELTFSCIAPIGGLHCGNCNKCLERQGAFRLIDLPDRTEYAIDSNKSSPTAALT